jgi:predicted dehydrogenase
METKPLNHPVRLGVIGAGGIARSSHLPALAMLAQQTANVSVVALADPSDKALQSARARLREMPSEIHTYSDGCALLKDAPQIGCNALLLLTPPEVTPDLIRAALPLCLPIFTEKPVAADVASLAALVNDATYPGTPPIQVGYNRRFQPIAPHFKEEVCKLWERSAAPLHIDAHLWRINRSEAIFYRDTMIHAVDFLLWCSALPPNVRTAFVTDLPNTGSDAPLKVVRVSTARAAQPDGIPSALRADLIGPIGTVSLDVRPDVGRDRETYCALGTNSCIENAYPAASHDPSLNHLSHWRSSLQTHLRSNTPPIFKDNHSLWTRGFFRQMEAFVQLAAQYTAGQPVASPCTLQDALAARTLTEKLLKFQS